MGLLRDDLDFCCSTGGHGMISLLPSNLFATTRGLYGTQQSGRASTDLQP